MRRIIKWLAGGSLLVLLGGCTASNPAEEAVSAIDAAIEKNHELDSATYETSIITQNAEEKHEVRADGTFIKTGDTAYNWNHITYFEGDSASAIEVLALDGAQYERVTIPDPEFVPEWTALPEPTHDLMEKIGPLFENHIVADDIEEVTVTETDGETYQVTLKDSYIEEIRAEEVAFFQEQIAFLQDNDAEDFVISAYEAELAMIEQREYSNLLSTYTIDQEGVLVSFSQSYTVTEPEAGTYEEIYSYALTDYNMENAESLLPAVE